MAAGKILFAKHRRDASTRSRGLLGNQASPCYNILRVPHLLLARRCTCFCQTDTTLARTCPMLFLLLVLVLSRGVLKSHAALSLDGPGIKHLPECARLTLELSIHKICSTVSCICDSQDLPFIIHAVSTAVNIQCSNNTYDTTAAMAAVISYCKVHSFTVPSALATIAKPPGKDCSLCRSSF